MCRVVTSGERESRLEKCIKNTREKKTKKKKKKKKKRLVVSLRDDEEEDDQRGDDEKEKRLSFLARDARGEDEREEKDRTQSGFGRIFASAFIAEEEEELEEELEEEDFELRGRGDCGSNDVSSHPKPPPRALREDYS